MIKTAVQLVIGAVLVVSSTVAISHELIPWWLYLIASGGGAMVFGWGIGVVLAHDCYDVWWKRR